METIYFEEVSVRGEKKGKCACGKSRVRRETFTNTISPFNKNEKGEIRNRFEVMECVKQDREEWLKEAIYCENCRPLTIWEITKEEREEYNTKGKVMTKTKLGLPYLKINPTFK